MKKGVIGLLFLGMYVTIEALNPSIVFPSRLGGADEKEFELEFHRPVSAVDDGTISSVIVEGHYKLNGKLLHIPEGVSNHRGETGEQLKGFRGSMQFFPGAKIDNVRTCLDNARLDRVDEKDGYFEVYYAVPEGVVGDKKDMKVSTQQSGRLYQCPMPHMIHVGGHVKTPFLHVKSDPVCHGLSDEACQKQQKRAYVHKNNIYPIEGDNDRVTVAPMGEKALAKTYAHSTVGLSSAQLLTPNDVKYCTHGTISAEIKPTMVSDETAAVPHVVPLAWNVMKGTDDKGHLFAYHHYAQCGDKTLKSQPFAWQAEQASIHIPGAHHIGFKMPEKEAHKDEQGNAMVPPLYATRFTQEKDNTITMSCMYGDPRNQADMLVLSTPLGVSAERCYLYGKDAANSRDFDGMSLKDKYTVAKDVTIVSRTDKKSEVPVALHVLPLADTRQ